MGLLTESIRSFRREGSLHTQSCAFKHSFLIFIFLVVRCERIVSEYGPIIELLVIFLAVLLV